MDEFLVRCPKCEAMNNVIAQDVPLRTPISCSRCGWPLGDLDDFLSLMQVKAPPLGSPEPDDR